MTTTEGQVRTGTTKSGLTHRVRSGPGSVRTRADHAVGVTGPSDHVLDRMRWQRRYTANLLIADTAVVCGAVLLAQFIRFGQASLAPGTEDHSATVYSVLIAMLWLSALAGFHARSTKIVGRGIEEYRRVVEGSLWTFVTIALAELLFKLELARGYLAVALPAGIIGLLLVRSLVRKHVARARVNGRYRTAVLAVGRTGAIARLADEFERNPSDGMEIVGACVPGSGSAGEPLPSGCHKGIPILGDETAILEAIDACSADTVAIVGTDHLDVHEIRKLTWKLEPTGVNLVVSPGVLDIAISRLAVLPVAGLPLLQIGRPQYRDARRFQKRAFDFCFALAALMAALPILLLAAVAIKLSSKGPIFYSSQRIGLGGKPFGMLKLRTMVPDADKMLASLLDSNECGGQMFKIRDDPRITPVGRFLRRFSIDELPQFINVLRQEMSVVGPRPLFTLPGEQFDGDSEHRLLVKPGITGLWQVSGRSDLAWADAMRLDLSYVDNCSMTSDLVIIAKTVRSVFERRGAY